MPRGTPQPELKLQPERKGMWLPALLHLLNRAPCFLPAMAVLGAALNGYGWCMSVIAMVAAWFVGKWRILAACFVCCSIVLLIQIQQQENSRRVVAEALQSGVVTVQGTVVQKSGRSCVVDTGWPGTRVSVYGDAPVRCGDVVEITGVPHDTAAPLVPGMFDPLQRMKGLGICAELDYIRCDVQGHPASWASLRGASQDVRASLEKILMPEGKEEDPRRQVLCALVLGDKSGADPATMMEFQRGGCMHAFAVSGLHVGLVAGLLLLVMRLAHVPPAVSRYVLLVGLAVYVWVTGMAVPAQRAYLMLAAVVGARILKRQVNLLNIWCFAGLVILVVEPWQVFQSGFQLSFAVYAALCVGVRLCMRDAPWFGPDPYIPYRVRTDAELKMRNLDRAVRGVVMVAVCAWVGSLPLTYGHFHAFNTYGVLTNIAITPILPVVMGAGMLAIACCGIPYLNVVVDAVAVKAAGVLVAVVSFFAGLPASYIPACPTRAPHEGLVVQLHYGNSVCLLGNPGLLIDCGNVGDVRYTVQPLLFHDGFTPAVMLETRPLASRNGGKKLMQSFWPKMRTLRVTPGHNSTLETSAGTFRVYGAPADISPNPAANVCPIVTWKSARGLVVYVGDASIATLEGVQEDLSGAAYVILGHNKVQTVDSGTLCSRMPGATVVLLPPAIEAGVTADDFKPLNVKCLNDSTPMLRLE